MPFPPTGSAETFNSMALSRLPRLKRTLIPIQNHSQASFREATSSSKTLSGTHNLPSPIGSLLIATNDLK